MSSVFNPATSPQAAASSRIRAMRPPLWVPLVMLGVAWLASGIDAQAQSLRQGVAAFNRQDYVLAARILVPYAERGASSAQAYLGFMYETGRGVPQNYTEAAMWYRRAAEQGDSLAQYQLGVLYDRGQGVPQDIVEASKWLNLGTAGAPRYARESRSRIRDAVARKMTRGEIAQSRLRALEWVPRREVP